MTTKPLKQVYIAVDKAGRPWRVWADKETARQAVEQANSRLALGAGPWTVVAMRVSPVCKRVKS